LALMVSLIGGLDMRPPVVAWPQSDRLRQRSTNGRTSARPAQRPQTGTSPYGATA